MTNFKFILFLRQVQKYYFLFSSFTENQGPKYYMVLVFDNGLEYIHFK